jgi:hypothetical protein
MNRVVPHSFAFAILASLSLPGTPLQQSQVRGNVRCAETIAVRRDAPRQEGADPLGSGPWYINADSTIWALKQPWRAGSLLKTAWIKPIGSTLRVTGRRLDEEAPPLQFSIPADYSGGFQASRLMFPTVGCWEVRAIAGRSTLTFLTSILPPN